MRDESEIWYSHDLLFIKLNIIGLNLPRNYKQKITDKTLTKRRLTLLPNASFPPRNLSIRGILYLHKCNSLQSCHKWKGNALCSFSEHLH